MRIEKSLEKKIKKRFGSRCKVMNHQYDEASDDYRCEADRVHLKNMYFDMNPDKKSVGLTSNKPNILSEAS